MAILEVQSFERTGSELLIRFETEEQAERMEQALGAMFPVEEKPEPVEQPEPPVVDLPEEEVPEGMLVSYHIKSQWKDGMVVVVHAGNATDREQVLAVRLDTPDTLEDVWGGECVQDGEGYVIRSGKPVPVGGTWEFTFKTQGTDGRIEISGETADEPIEEAEPEPEAEPVAEAKPVSDTSEPDAPGTLVYAPTLDITKDAKKNILEALGGVYDGGWDWENIEILDLGDGPCLRTHIEKGATVRDKNKRRGAGFDTRTLQAEHAFLTYDLRFKPGFDPVKGGKLPGLMGGDSPSGHKSADNGFTARLMWRREAEGELYLYYPDMQQSHGDSIGRGNFVFDCSGGLHSVMQEVKLNDVGQANGLIRVWYDGKLEIERTGLRLRTKDSVLIEGIMHTIFFGGSDSSWAASRDEWVETRNFRIYVP